MMQPCASTAKLLGGGPNLCNVDKTMESNGSPPPRTVVGTDDPWIVDPGNYALILRSCGCNSTPSGISPVVTICHSAISNLRARATIMILRISLRRSAVLVQYHLANALSFWYQRNRHASSIMPRCT